MIDLESPRIPKKNMNRMPDTTSPLSIIPFDSIPLASDDPMLTHAWDANVEARSVELESLSDASYRALINLILRLLAQETQPPSSILDAGCGLGYLTYAIHQAGYGVVGIDPSMASIEHAKTRFSDITFIPQTIEKYASTPLMKASYNAVIANMTMHTTPNLSSFAAGAYSVLRSSGVFIATIPHPVLFLATKASLDSPPEYSSSNEFLISFKINGGHIHPSPVPYFHRTIATYSEELYKAGFRDVQIHEPKYVGPRRRFDVLVVSASRQTTT